MHNQVRQVVMSAKWEEARAEAKAAAAEKQVMTLAFMYHRVCVCGGGGGMYIRICITSYSAHVLPPSLSF